MPIRRWFRDKCWYWEYLGLHDGKPLYALPVLLRCHYTTADRGTLSGDVATEDWSPAIAFAQPVTVNGAITAFDCTEVPPDYPSEDGGRRKISIIQEVSKISRLDKKRECIWECTVQ